MFTKYPLKVESDLWFRFKLKCMANHKTMLQVLTNFIKQYVEEKKMTLEQATKKVLRLANNLNVTDEEVISTCIKMYLNNPTKKASKTNKMVKQHLERNRNSKPVDKWEGLTMAEINRMNAQDNLPSSMK